MPEPTLFGRLLPPVLGVLALGLAMLGWVAWGAMEGASPERVAGSLGERATGFTQAVEQALENPGGATCRQLRPAAVRVTLLASSGRVVCDLRGDPELGELPPPTADFVAAGEGEAAWTVQRVESSGRVWVSVAISLQGGAVLLLAQPLPAPPEARATLLARLVAGGGAAVLLGFGVVLWVSAWLGRRLAEMSATAGGYGEGHLGGRPPLAGFREGRELTNAMQAMAQKLEQRFQALTRRQGELEAVLRGMAEGVLAVDGRERVLDLNPTAAALFGVELEAVRGRYLLEVVRLPELVRFVSATLGGEEPRQGEVEVLRRGEPVFLQAYGSVLRGLAGEKIGALVVLHDVTALRRLETVRRDFVTNVSHELKTPITAIKGFVETLQGGALHQPAEAERFLKIVSRQVERLQNIVEDLLDLSRVEQEAERGGIPLAPAPLRPVLRAAVRECESRAQQNGVVLKLKCPATLEAAINGPLLEQAVVNLVDNAIKYGGEGGAVLVEGVAGDNGPVIRVRDQGPGIPAVELPRLFERFYRVDRARSRSLGGTGLGLAIVKHIAQAHGGRAEVESLPGKGATFSLSLPPPEAGPAAPGS